MCSLKPSNCSKLDEGKSPRIDRIPAFYRLAPLEEYIYLCCVSFQHPVLVIATVFVRMSDSGGGYGGNIRGDLDNGDILKEKKIRRYIEDLLPKRFVTTHTKINNLHVFLILRYDATTSIITGALVGLMIFMWILFKNRNALRIKFR